jgi:hypothetical protein
MFKPVVFLNNYNLRSGPLRGKKKNTEHNIQPKSYQHIKKLAFLTEQRS